MHSTSPGAFASPNTDPIGRYAFGDTRKRGMALLRFKHAYRAAGATLGEHELPDHLAVVLEFAATVDPVVGRRLLIDYRPVVELLRLSLHEAGSPYLAVLATPAPGRYPHPLPRAAS